MLLWNRLTILEAATAQFHRKPSLAHRRHLSALRPNALRIFLGQALPACLQLPVIVRLLVIGHASPIQSLSPGLRVIVPVGDFFESLPGSIGLLAMQVVFAKAERQI